MKRKHDEDDSPVKINLTVGGYKVKRGLAVNWCNDDIDIRTRMADHMCCPW